MKGGGRKPYRPLHKTTQTGKRIPCTSGIMRQVGVKIRLMENFSQGLWSVTGPAALQFRTVRRHLFMTACTGMRAVQTVNRKEIAVFGTVGNICLVMAYGTGNIDLSVLRHDMVTGTASKRLVFLMPKTHMHLFALCVFNGKGVFNNFLRFIQCSRLCNSRHSHHQPAGKQGTQKKIFHIQSSFRIIIDIKTLLKIGGYVNGASGRTWVSPCRHAVFREAGVQRYEKTAAVNRGEHACPTCWRRRALPADRPVPGIY